MQRFRQIWFSIVLLALCWLAMMAVHELGHAIGAVITGGSVVRVVLRPLTISRTDVAPNPHPAVVVWLGPIVGCLLPLAACAVMPTRAHQWRNIARFFAGFCLIANGAYISTGSWDRIGDCRDMFRTGTPLWIMWVFGAMTVPTGLMLWHRLGSPSAFARNRSTITSRMTVLVSVTLAVLVIAELAFSPR